MVLPLYQVTPLRDGLEKESEPLAKEHRDSFVDYVDVLETGKALRGLHEMLNEFKEKPGA